MKERRMVFEERVVVGELHFVEVHRVLSSRMLRRAHFSETPTHKPRSGRTCG